MKAFIVFGVLLVASFVPAQTTPDDAGIQQILKEQAEAWNKGDAAAYAQHFAADGTFTNLLGMFFTGPEAFRARHDQIFKGNYKGSFKQEDVVSIKFVRPDVAIVETLQTITNYQKLLPGTSC